MAYVIVTGASSGIGEACCYELAQRGYDLIVVARQKDTLMILKEKLEFHYQRDVVVLPFDLSQEDQVKDFCEVSEAYDVIGLVNNAGYGLYGTFAEIDLEAELNMLDLNIKSVHILSKVFVRRFMDRGEGYLLNVSSTAAFQSGPLMASYYASKGYVLQLTEALAEEIKESHPGVIVSVLCPGPVATNFQKRAAIGVAGSRVPTAEEVASYGVKQWFKGQVLIIPKFQNRLLVFGNRFIPRKLGRFVVKKNQLKKK